ncbi:hypothetical protein ACFIOY_15850 [Bradyrhizobium sp. TZ2]
MSRKFSAQRHIRWDDGVIADHVLERQSEVTMDFRSLQRAMRAMIVAFQSHVATRDRFAFQPGLKIATIIRTAMRPLLAPSTTGYTPA